MKHLYLGLFLLTACGTDDSAEQKPVTVEYQKTDQGTAVALGNTADLPPCQEENDRQLAYVKSQEQFYTCTNGTWEAIAKETPAPIVAPEPAVVAEEPVEPEQPKVAPIAPVNQWVDPVTGDTWFVGTVAPFARLAQACVGDWEPAPSYKVQMAVLHGIGVLTGTATNVWAAEPLWNEIKHQPEAVTIVLIADPDGGPYTPGPGDAVNAPQFDEHLILCLAKSK